MLDYESIEKHYLRKGGPSGFFDFMNKNNVPDDDINTCGIRLSMSLLHNHGSGQICATYGTYELSAGAICR